ncbi:MAG: type IV pilus modification protein PilV [Lautropia sp.]|nr:type IV pilus modification protein PilV [Lautropia sp.]
MSMNPDSRIRVPVMSLRGRGLNAVRMQQGSGLIEVLVAVVLLTVGMLSLLMTQTKAVQYERSAELRGMAQQLAGGYADRMRANSKEVARYVFNTAYNPDQAVGAPATDCVTSRCDAAQMAAFDLSELRQGARNALPGGDFFVESHGGNRYTIWTVWLQPRQLDTPVSGSGSVAATNDRYEEDMSFSGRCPAALGTYNPRPQCLPLGVML